MSDYEKELKRLGDINSKRHDALSAFIAKHPRLNDALLPEFGRLRDEYTESFSNWIAFCEAHAGPSGG